MKTKLLLLSLLMTSISLSVNAQKEDKNIFDHLAVGITAGTPGIGVDVATPVTNYVQLRAGFAIFPTIKVNTHMNLNRSGNINGYEIPSSIDVQGKTGFTNGKFLVDVFPFKHCAFHVTAGAYFGSTEIVKAYNKEPGALSVVNDYNNSEYGIQNPIGLQLGDYFLTPDEDGNVNAQIKAWACKPYVGLGYGRAVPNKRVGFMVELGCQFWGSPSVWCNGTELEEDKVGEGSGGIIKTLSKIIVYPVLNFRICGRIL
ncbi:MAG: hypothetical protein LUC91_03680 [Prevotella sp.]|nr:hypothetical protein [Prevotella sp.]